MSTHTATGSSPTQVLGRIGPFKVNSDGVLIRNNPDEVAGFGFRWRGRRVSARLGEGSILHLSVPAAHVPFTAEGLGDRAPLIAAASVLRKSLPVDWVMAFGPSSTVRFEMKADLGAPPTASRLVTAATRFVLELDPCIDLLDELGAHAA